MEVINIMQKADLHYLPVFDKAIFIGVITLISLATARDSQIKNTHNYNYKAIQDIKNSVSTIKGLTNVLSQLNTDKAIQELIQLLNVSCLQTMHTIDDLL